MITGLLAMWDIWGHFLADAQVAIVLGFCLHIIFPGKDEP
jgi:hypothetical protein